MKHSSSSPVFKIQQKLVSQSTSNIMRDNPSFLDEEHHLLPYPLKFNIKKQEKQSGLPQHKSNLLRCNRSKDELFRQEEQVDFHLDGSALVKQKRYSLKQI